MNYFMKSGIYTALLLCFTSSAFAEVFIKKISNFTIRGYEIEFTNDNTQDYSMLVKGLLASGQNRKYFSFNCETQDNCSILIDERSELISKQADPTGIAVQEVHALYLSAFGSKKSEALVGPIRELLRDAGNYQFVNGSILTGSMRSICSSDNLGRRSCASVPSVMSVTPSTGLALQSSSGNLICSEIKSDFKSCIIATSEMIETINAQIDINARIGVHHLSLDRIQTNCQIEVDSGNKYNVAPRSQVAVNIFFPNYPHRRYAGEFLNVVKAEEIFGDKPLKDGDITCVAADKTDGIIVETLICTNNTERNLDFKVYAKYKTCNTPLEI